MGGDYVEEDWVSDNSSNDTRTVVLVGRTGNGKSATGNSILGKKVFKSRSSSSGVTSFCEMHSAELNDGHIVNIIDTPGLFDNSAEPEFLGKEIVKCIDLAKDGIHAILLVFSVRTRFTDEEVTAIESLQMLFGSKIVDYMIVVFTGGDDLEENDESLEDYLGSKCPKPLKEVLSLCKNRCVLFDNKTKDEKKKYEQVQQLLSLVNMVISQNGGQPYTNELFQELKKEAIQKQQREAELKGRSEEEILEMKMQMQQAHEEQLKQIVDKVETKLNEATKQLEKRLAEEQAARLKAEEKAETAKKISDDENRKLKNDLDRAHAELHNRRGNHHGCAIL